MAAGIADQPSSAVIQSGERTGAFAIDTDHMVTDRDGNCRISREDFAVAIIDELENPKFDKQRFTVGYR
jgi:putative NADH-flavin reductase